MAWLLPRTGLNDLENVPKTLLPADKRVCLSFAFTIMVVKIKATNYSNIHTVGEKRIQQNAIYGAKLP